MRRITFHDYAGVKIAGKKEAPGPGHQHIDRASWLTAMVESGGKFGTVISYDGTGMTAGIHQAIAVYPRGLTRVDHNPKNDQGPLWGLVQRCMATQSVWLDRTDNLIGMIDTQGWVIVAGELRYQGSGRLVGGHAIRGNLTGDIDGVMPKTGSDRVQAERWARAFSDYFGAGRTFQPQLDWGKEKLIKKVTRVKLRHSPQKFYRRKTAQDVFYGDDLFVGTVLASDLEPCFDLAMCMWLSFMVNAPAIALRHLCKVISVYNADGVEAFSKALIERLGNAQWGRWDDDIKNGRYQRTRRFAKQVWPKELFSGSDAVMPKNLEG